LKIGSFYDDEGKTVTPSWNRPLERPMHWKVIKEELLDALGTVTTVVGPRSTIPVLQHVLLSVQGEELILAATDLEVSIETRIGGHFDSEGSLTVPARRLFSLVRELPAGELELEVEPKGNLILRTANAYYRLVGLPGEEFPSFRKLEDGVPCELPQEVLRKLLRRTSYAMSHDESRYVLNGVFFAIRQGKVTAAATDGRRLAVMEQELAGSQGVEAEAILPAKAVRELERFLGASEDPVRVWLEATQAGFEIGKTFMQCKLIEGRYPDFRTVIPGQSSKSAALPREALLGAVHRVSLVGADRPSSIFLRFSQGQLEVSSVVPEVGEAREAMEAEYSGEDFTIAFNPQYLMEPLREMEGEKAHFSMSDRHSACVIRNAEPFLYVLMPVRTP
jgi:DNA polymerase-3 subunit beta